MPLVSVIIPNYNHEQFLKQRIRSVLQQTFTDFELIILDDASTDNSRAIIEEFKREDGRITFYPSAKNSGSPFIQWNKGVKLAKADLIWIAESDDHASPDFLKVMYEAHAAHSTIALAYCQSNKINEAGTVTGSWKSFTDDINQGLFCNDFIMDGKSFIDQFLIHKNVIPNASAVLFNRNVYNKVGGADENLQSNSDWLTWLKMLLQYPVAFVSKPMNNFRFHTNSVISKVHASSSSENYKEQYDLTMRNAFDAYCRGSATLISKSIKAQNKKYKAFDYGNKGICQLRNGELVKGTLNIFKASVSPALTLGYLRKLIKEEN